MATKQYPFTTPANYVYEGNKIEVSGGVAKLKENLDGVYARYHLNEATGATVLDTSGNGRNGTPVNSPISVVGKLNNALSFNGSNQYVICGDIANFERTDSFSLECWFKTSALATSKVLLGRQYGSGTYRGWTLLLASNNRLTFQLYNSTSNFLSVNIEAVVIDGAWHHIIVTYDGTSTVNGVKFYLDGGNKDTFGASTLTLTTQNSTYMSIGSMSGIAPMNGKIDEAVIYDKELTQSEVSFKYNSGTGIERQSYYTLSKIYAHYHLNSIDSGDSVEDVSGNDRDGIAINSPSVVGGKLNNCFQFNGTTQYVNCGDIGGFERSDKFSLECWFKTNTTSNSLLIGKIDPNSPYPGYQLIILSTGNIILDLFNNYPANYLRVKTNETFNDNAWHHVIVTYDGSSLGSGVKIYIDNVSRVVTSEGTLSASIINTANLSIGSRSGSSLFFNGYIDEVVIYEKVLNQLEVTFRYNSGAGRENASFAPVIKPTTSWSPIGAIEWTEFNEILGGSNQGNVAYQLSNDDGVTWIYWNGSTWILAGEEKYNDAQTIEDNLTSITEHAKIMFKAFLISNGMQQVELDDLEIVAIAGDPPIVYAGIDKNCYDNQQIKPFNDATISDPDGDIELAHAYYNIETSGWVEIAKGGYGTLQEAVRNFQYTFNNPGIINCQLKVIDEQAKETIDDLDVTVQKYTVTFNVKDSQGNHIANIYFKPGDGSGNVEKHSPFTYDYDYNSSGYDVIVDKGGYGIQTQNVPSTDHTENFTLIALIDTSTFADDIKRLLGLNQENYRVLNPVYDAKNNLTSATIRIYPTANDCENDTNPISEYTVYATYSVNQLLSYKVKRA